MRGQLTIIIPVCATPARFLLRGPGTPRSCLMRTQINAHSILHGLFRSGLPWLLVAVLMLGNLILSQTSAVLH
jgi:hypothetical protein